MMFTEEHKVKYLQTLNAIIEENLRKCLYFGVFLRFSCLASGKVGLYHVGKVVTHLQIRLWAVLPFDTVRDIN